MTSYAFLEKCLHSLEEAQKHDYALLHLNNSVGDTTGYLFPLLYDASLKKATLSGYPGEVYKEREKGHKKQTSPLQKKGTEQYKHKGPLYIKAGDETLYHGIHTTGGNSGSALRVKYVNPKTKSKEWRIIGLHVRNHDLTKDQKKKGLPEEELRNESIKMTKDVFHTIRHFSLHLLNNTSKKEERMEFFKVEGGKKGIAYYLT